MTLMYKAGASLVGSRVGKMDAARWTELQFADDIAIITKSRDGITHAMQKLFKVTGQWGLTISVHKTKVMVIGGDEEVHPPLQVNDVQLQISWISFTQ